MKGFVISLVLMLLFLRQSQAIQIDSNDLMNGHGLFLGSSISDFQLEHSHQVHFITINGSNILRLQKPVGQQVSYKSGLHYSFPATKISHIQFKFASTNPDIQDSNLRIYDTNDTTLVLFRAGRGGLIRVNQKQMIDFYNSSVSTDSEIHLTQVDLKLNWEQKIIEIFINNKFKDHCNFFQKNTNPVSEILIYNLYHSVSYWSDLVICQNICYSFNFEVYLKFAFVIIFYFLI